MPELRYPSRMKGGQEKTPEVIPTPAGGKGFVDQENGAHTSTPTNRNLKLQKGIA